MRIYDTQRIVKEQGLGISLLKRGWGQLRDYKGGRAVLRWGGRSEFMQRNGLFFLELPARDSHKARTVVLSKDDLQYLLRNV